MEKNELFRCRVHYYGTTIGNSFWKRYKDDEFFFRDDGELRLTRTSLYFRRYLTLKPIKIPIKKVRAISTGRGHAGKFTLKPVFKIHWLRDETELVSGFSIYGTLKDILNFQRKLIKVSKAKFL